MARPSVFLCLKRIRCKCRPRPFHADRRIRVAYCASSDATECCGPDDAPSLAQARRASTGQKATALLYCFFLKRTARLFWISRRTILITGLFRRGSLQRYDWKSDAGKSCFCTHNANIPVLGDAELICSRAAGELHGGARSPMIWLAR